MPTLLDSVRRSLLKKRTLWVFALVIVGNIALENETVRENLPFITILQLRAHASLSHIDRRQEVVKWVAAIPIDDDCFWKAPFSGRQPTNRRAIADLANAAADADAAVVAIDFLLLSTGPTGDDPAFAEENRYLMKVLTSIVTETRQKNAVRRGRPVILGTLLVADKDEQWTVAPNLFDRLGLPTAVQTGFLNLPNDPRRLPLQTLSASGEVLDSFAVQIVAARERVGAISPGALDDADVKNAIAGDRPLLAGFIRPGSFTRVSACDLLARKPSAMSQLYGRAVIIGSAWHKYGPNTGPLEESFESPVGEVPGLLMHANYVEALMTGAYKPAAARWVGPSLDLLVGILLYLSFELARNRLQKIGVITIVFVPLLVAYVLQVNVGRYLDFVPLLFLFLVDLAFELYHGRGSEHSAAGAAAATGHTP